MARKDIELPEDHAVARWHYLKYFCTQMSYYSELPLLQIPAAGYRYLFDTCTS